MIASGVRWGALVMVLLAGFASGAGRAMLGARGDAIVIGANAVVVLTLVLASARLACGDRRVVPLILASAVTLSIMLAAASTVAYPGDQSLSSAGIQFLRAAQQLAAALPIDSAGSRLTLYPTSFAGLNAVSALTGVDVGVLIQWSWALSMPLLVMGFGLFVGAFTRSQVIGALAMVVALTDPWHFARPVYDGFNIVLLPAWSYLVVLMLRRPKPGIVLAVTLLTVAITTSHLFTSLFAVAIAAAIGVAALISPLGLAPKAAGAAREVLGRGVRGVLIPTLSIATWLVYVTARYLREGAGLVAAFLSALGRAGPSENIVGLSLLVPAQQLILLLSVATDGVFAAGAAIWLVRRPTARLRSAMVLAVFAIPFVAWAIVTPPQFANGTDLKEWKVRPLFGAFLLVAALLGLGIWVLARSTPRHLRTLLVAAALGVVLLNAQTLSLTYGDLGTHTYISETEPSVVEDAAIPPEQYRALGDYVRRALDRKVLLIADWRQSNWMAGEGGVQTPLFQSAALSNAQDLARDLAISEVAGVAVDRNLLRWPSLYTGRKADVDLLLDLDRLPLDRVFDSGQQQLYLKPFQ